MRGIREKDTDRDAGAAVWETTLRTRGRDGPSDWLHADLMPDSLLMDDDRLSAMIGFGFIGVGDPACDLVPNVNRCSLMREKSSARQRLWMNATWLRRWGVGLRRHHAHRGPANPTLRH